MQKFKLEPFRDDPNIKWATIPSLSYAPSINFCVRQIDSQMSYVDDCAMQDVNVTRIPLSLDNEATFRHDAIKAFRDLHLNSWLSKWKYDALIPYAPPSFEYYRDPDNEYLITIDICFHHDLGTYNKIKASGKVDDKFKRNLAGLYQLYQMDVPDYAALYSDEESE